MNKKAEKKEIRKSLYTKSDITVFFTTKKEQN